MSLYLVQQVGVFGPAIPIEAHCAHAAAVAAAGCDWRKVPLPIWRDGLNRYTGEAHVQCYMPLDDTGRQWVVTDPRPIPNWQRGSF